MTIARLFTLTAICLTSVFIIFGQAKQITKDEYYTPFRASLQKERSISRRKVSTSENYKDGKLSRTVEWIYEYLVPDTIRYQNTETFEGKRRRVEQININKAIYCRRDSGDWKISQSSCVGGTGSGISNVVSSRYSIEKANLNGKKMMLYQQYTIYKDSYSINSDKEGLSYWEAKYWLNDEGLIIREESKSGLIEPHRINRFTVDTYEYNPKLKIEAPIK